MDSYDNDFLFLDDDLFFVCIFFKDKEDEKLDADDQEQTDVG